MNDFSFSGQKDNEEVILIVRQHAWKFFIFCVETVAILVIYLTVFYFFKNTKIVNWTAIIGGLVFLYLFLKTWFEWWNQVYIITNERLISVEQKGWFSRSMSESNLENVLFINHEIKGPIKTLFNFGNVRISASGVNEEELLFSNVFDPYEIQQIIVKTQKIKKGLPLEQDKPINKDDKNFVIR